MASERAIRLTDSFNEIDPALGDEVYWQTVEATAEKFLLEERREAAETCIKIARQYALTNSGSMIINEIAEKFGLEKENC